MRRCGKTLGAGQVASKFTDFYIVADEPAPDSDFLYDAAGTFETYLLSIHFMCMALRRDVTWQCIEDLATTDALNEEWGISLWGRCSHIGGHQSPAW